MLVVAKTPSDLIDLQSVGVLNDLGNPKFSVDLLSLPGRTVFFPTLAEMP